MPSALSSPPSAFKLSALRYSLLIVLAWYMWGKRGKVYRLLRSLHSSQAAPEDVWASSILTPEEYRVYSTMDARDREHGTRVAQKLQQDMPEIGGEVIAAAILHDCGKSSRPYHALERVWVGLVPYRLARWLRHPALHVRFHHPRLGAEMLQQAGAREQVSKLVAQHHQPHSHPHAKLLYLYDHLE